MQQAHFHLHKRKRIHKKLEKYPHPNKWKRLLDNTVLALAIIGPLMNLPQLHKIFFLKTAAGISTLTFSLLVILNIPWLIYGFVHKEKPIIISSIMWTITHGMILIGAIIYG